MNSNRNFSEDIVYALDGEKDIASDKQLFEELAKSESLRGEFQEHILIKNAVQSEAPIILPSDISQAVFDNIAGKSLWARHSGLIKNAGSFVAGLILAGSIYYHNSGENLVNVADYSARNKYFPVEKAVVVKTIETKTVVKPQYVYITEAKQESNDNRASANDNTLIEPIAQSSIAPLKLANATMSEPLAFNSISSPRTNSTFAPRNFNISIPEFHIVKGIDFGLSARGLMSRSLTANDIKTSAENFDNTAISLRAAITKSDMVGIEVGQETFGQEFSDAFYAYRQKPSLFWAGAFYRRYFNDYSVWGGLTPFSQAFIGSTKLGPLGKVALGFNYRTQGNLNVGFGLEGSMMVYKYQGQTFNSKKIGIFYELGFNF